jgi:hypothetical protein
VKEEKNYAKPANGLKEAKTSKIRSIKAIGKMCYVNSENGRGAKCVQVG